ncbi:MAG: EAL domain-containing protein [Butyrivibrio sp.]|nr:EAL domain-containing protein [Butyrivibrio sp.]
MSLLISGLLMFVMFYTKPRKTYVYKYIFVGNFLSIIASLLQIIILRIASVPDRYYNRYIFLGLLLAFLLVYNGILYFIFSYVNMMSIARREQRKEFLLMYILLSIVYVAGVIVEVVSGGLYTVSVEGIDLTRFTRFYCTAGIICCLVSFYASLTNKRHISRVIWTTVCLIVPIEVIMLVAQIITVKTYGTMFTGITYAPIFMLAFLLFHGVPYDEESGCGSQSALDDFLLKNLGRKRFYIMYVQFAIPALDVISFDDKDLTMTGINACRSIEAISPNVHMFRLEQEKFVNIIDVSDEKEAFRIVEEIRGVFDRVKLQLKIPFNYAMIAGEAVPEIESTPKYRQFMEYIYRVHSDKDNSHYYYIQPSDYEEFRDIFEITATLKDIRNRLDLEDERVLVYAQPIFSVESGSFKVAEALMRIKLGDRIITPDKFIPIAEDTGCVHALTSIILNKVCKTVETLSEHYDFDAISINVSSKELSEKNMHANLLEIIDSYDIDTSKIRMEITESAMFDKYDIANRNMEILTNAGIQFYLDDFGTGYSSLERVMNCPFKTIKFDKTLLYKSLDDNRMDDVMAYMIEVFKKNGFVTLVEGVEDEAQNKYSMDRGFDYIQGYHYAKPAPIEELRKYFNKKSLF